MSTQNPFFGPWVIRATFTMAAFGWGIGFYGPPIYLHAVLERTDWPLSMVSAAVTVHYLVGALVILLLPRAHRQFGVGPTAAVGAICASLGVMGWSVANVHWQLFASALLSGAGWVTMGAVAVNAAIAPWFSRNRPMALSKAYNGASIGGVLFSPLWVWLIQRWGFTTAAALVGMLTAATMTALACTVFAQTPRRLGQHPDGQAAADDATLGPISLERAPIHGPVWRDRRFATLALGMAAGLFAQIGLLAHLFWLLVPTLGAQAAGMAMGFATACAILGRMICAQMLRPGVERRHVAALAYAVQMVGTITLLWVDAGQPALILLAVALFGSGIGNATSLPPLIAQAEFCSDEVPRVVAHIVATAQASYAFAPAMFGLVLSASVASSGGIGAGTWPFFLIAAVLQVFAMACFLAGRDGGMAR